MKSICRESCPWFSEGRNDDGGGYGCHKYTIANHCAIHQIKGVIATEYELVVDPDKENGLMRELFSITIPTLGVPGKREAASIVRTKPIVEQVP